MNLMTFNLICIEGVQSLTTLMKKMYEDGGSGLVKLLVRVKDHDIATSLDLTAVDADSPAGKEDWSVILSNVLPFTDFFEPSYEELCFMLDRPLYEKRAASGGDMTEQDGITSDADRLAERCLEMGCGAVLIKCGLSGMVYRTGGSARLSETGSRLALDIGKWADKAGVQPCFRAENVLSATGAGDVSIAAWLTALMRGEAPDVCTRLAAAEGAASVSAYDALSGILPLDELNKRIAAGWN